VYFSALIIGNFFIIIGDSRTAAYYISNNGASIPPGNPLGTQTNILLIIGSLLVDTFFGLFPSFFLSVYKTSISKDIGHITMKYFITNGIIIGSFFIIIFVLALLHLLYQPDIVVLFELAFTTGIYIFTLFTLRKVRTKVKQLLRWFFFYFLIYAIPFMCRLILTIILYLNGGIANPAQPGYLQYYGITILFESLSSAFLMIGVCMLMKDLNLDHGRKNCTTTNPDTTSELRMTNYNNE